MIIIAALAVSAFSVSSPSHEVSSGTAPGRNDSFADKVFLFATTVGTGDPSPTPPLSRLPSAEENPPVLPPTIIPPLWRVEDAAAAAAEEQQRPRESWLKSIVATIMVAVRFLVGPNGQRTRQGCRGDDDDDDNHAPAQRATWRERAAAAARRFLRSARNKIKNAKDRLLAMFDISVAKRTARLLDLARKINVQDMPRRAGFRRQGSDELFEVDRSRLGVSDAVAAAVKEICTKLAAVFPVIGYNQGFDASCKAIFICVGGNLGVAAAVFTKWAVPLAWMMMNPYRHGQLGINTAMRYTWSVIKMHAAPVSGWLCRDPIVGCDEDNEMADTILAHIFMEPLSTFCSRLGLPQCVINDIVEETMRAGVHGPAVTIFVVMSLLCLAEKQGAEDADVVVMVKVPLMAAASSVKSFQDILEHAPVSLEHFLTGYRAAMVGVPACNDCVEPV
ncbi:unnamed protein product [Ectocarpus sp. CCAP 1310/34]|nr:unnamed protein product [Ectocarpus sp. CCAP 1310/34]